jgi:membrane-anchored glycerophosphoryl diester phosphodiesterase (GDPDase)
MMLFQDGKQLWRQSGVLTKEEIIKIILDKTNQMNNKTYQQRSNFKRKLALQRTVLITNLLFSILRTAMYFLIAGLSLKNVLKSKIVLPSK